MIFLLKKMEEEKEENAVSWTSISHSVLCGPKRHDHPGAQMGTVLHALLPLERFVIFQEKMLVDFI